MSYLYYATIRNLVFLNFLIIVWRVEWLCLVYNSFQISTHSFHEVAEYFLPIDIVVNQYLKFLTWSVNDMWRCRSRCSIFTNWCDNLNYTVAPLGNSGETNLRKIFETRTSKIQFQLSERNFNWNCISKYDHTKVKYIIIPL